MATSPAALLHLDSVRYYEQQDALVLDPVTVRNLELIAPLFAEDGRAAPASGRHFAARGARSKPPPAWARACCAPGFCGRRWTATKSPRASTPSPN